MRSKESARYDLSVFISHRHEDERIADILRQTITEWTNGDIKIAQSTDPGLGIGFGESIRKELKHVLTNVDLVLLVYTVPDEEWSYVMYEAGVAAFNPETANARIIVFAFGEHVPLPIEHALRVHLTRQNIQVFTEQFHRAEHFFPKIRESFAPSIPENIIAERAQSFYERLRETISPESEKSFVQLEKVLRNYRELDQRIRALEQTGNRKDAEDVDRWTISRKVFIVHGHDDALKSELARFLGALEFQPLILHEQPDRGQTIYGKLKEESQDVGYAFVLLTPDDVGRLASRQSKLYPRARQNVVFEHGLFVGHLGAHRVCAICRGQVETPSDLHGVIYKNRRLGPGLPLHRPREASSRTRVTKRQGSSFAPLRACDDAPRPTEKNPCSLHPLQSDPTSCCGPRPSTLVKSMRNSTLSSSRSTSTGR